MYSTRKVADLQEKRVAKAVGGRQTIASGQTPFSAGDVETTSFLYECKTKMAKASSITVQKEWLNKLEEERRASLKDFAALVISFGDKNNFYVLDERTFKALLEGLK